MTNQVIHQVRPAELVPSEDNPRTHMDKAELMGLARSIAALGVLQPVTAHPDTKVITFGHRRREAALLAISEKLVGEDFTIPVIFTAVTGDDAEQITRAQRLVENVQRSDMDPIDEAQGYKDLIDLDMSRAEVARKVGKSANHVSNRLALLHLPDAVRAQVRRGDLGLKLAEELASIFQADPELGFTVVSAGVDEYRITRAKQRLEQESIIAKAGKLADEAGLTWVTSVIDMPVPEGQVPVMRPKTLSAPDLNALMRGTKKAAFVEIRLNFKDEPVFSVYDWEEATSGNRKSQPLSDEERERRRIRKERKAHAHEQFERIMSERWTAGVIDELGWGLVISGVYSPEAKTILRLLNVDQVEGEEPSVTLMSQWENATTPQRTRIKVAWLIAQTQPIVDLARSSWNERKWSVLEQLGYVSYDGAAMPEEF